MSQLFTGHLRETIEKRISAFRPLALAADERKRAAVSILICPRPNTNGPREACFLLTRRTPRLKSHSGQWALPGGRVDSGETTRQAALREIHEEIGVALPDGAILGHLDDYPTRSGYLIRPFVIWLEEPERLVPSPSEVASIHYFPLGCFEREGSHIFVDVPDAQGPVIRLYLDDKEQVHAPTGAMLHQFAEVALKGRQTRVAHYDEPRWAWK